MGNLKNWEVIRSISVKNATIHLSSRLFVNMLSIRVAVEEVMRVGLEIKG